MKRITAILCALLALALLTSCAPRNKAPEDSIFSEIIVNGSRTHVDGLRSGMSVSRVLKKLGLDESEVDIEYATMNTVDPPIEYIQLETPAIYSYSENKNLSFKKAFYFQNGKLLFMLYHCSSLDADTDLDGFYEDSMKFILNFVENSGIPAAQEEGGYGYTARGYTNRASFNVQGSSYRVSFSKCGGLDEIGIGSQEESVTNGVSDDIYITLSIDVTL